MTYEKRTCKDMVKDTCNDMWSMLVRKHRRMSSNDMMGTDLQLHEGNIHEMTWLGRTGKEAMVAELSFRCMVSHQCFCNRLIYKRLQTKQWPTCFRLAWSATSRWRTGRRLPRRFDPLLAMTYEKRTYNDMVEDTRNNILREHLQ